MILYQSTQGPMVSANGSMHAVPEKNWDALINHKNLVDVLTEAATGPAVDPPDRWLAPIGT